MSSRSPTTVFVLAGTLSRPTVSMERRNPPHKGQVRGRGAVSTRAGTSTRQGLRRAQLPHRGCDHGRRPRGLDNPNVGSMEEYSVFVVCEDRPPPISCRVSVTGQLPDMMAFDPRAGGPGVIWSGRKAHIHAGEVLLFTNVYK